MRYLLVSTALVIALLRFRPRTSPIPAPSRRRGRPAGGTAPRDRVLGRETATRTMGPGRGGARGGSWSSNGREVAKTDADGALRAARLWRHEPVRHQARGLCRAGGRVPGPAIQLHLQGGAARPTCASGGIAPTGPLPEAVNFPLIRDDSNRASFECLVCRRCPALLQHAGSAMSRETAGKMLGRPRQFRHRMPSVRGRRDGRRPVALSAVQADHLGSAASRNTSWPANHDLDFDAEDDRHSFVTFRREWGPGILFVRYRERAFRGARQRAPTPCKRRRRPSVLRPVRETRPITA